MVFTYVFRQLEAPKKLLRLRHLIKLTTGHKHLQRARPLATERWHSLQLASSRVILEKKGAKYVSAVLLMTLVNTRYCAKKVSTVLWYFDVAESENDTGFSDLAPVFEIFHICVSKKC